MKVWGRTNLLKPARESDLRKISVEVGSRHEFAVELQRRERISSGRRAEGKRGKQLACNAECGEPRGQRGVLASCRPHRGSARGNVKHQQESLEGRKTRSRWSTSKNGGRTHLRLVADTENPRIRREKVKQVLRLRDDVARRISLRCRGVDQLPRLKTTGHAESFDVAGDRLSEELAELADGEGDATTVASVGVHGNAVERGWGRDSRKKVRGWVQELAIATGDAGSEGKEGQGRYGQ